MKRQSQMLSMFQQQQLMRLQQHAAAQQMYQTQEQQQPQQVFRPNTSPATATQQQMARGQPLDNMDAQPEPSPNVSYLMYALVR
jgi:uncharacterized protein YkwD